MKRRVVRRLWDNDPSEPTWWVIADHWAFPFERFLDAVWTAVEEDSLTGYAAVDEHPGKVLSWERA